MKLGMKVILPKNILPNAAALSRVIENTLTQSALAAKVDFGVTTQTWSAESKPTFKIESRMGARIIYTDSLIYLWVNNGTKAHDISPKNGGALTFRTGYRAKTRVGVIGSRGGGASGSWVSTRRTVRHPGTQARKFDEAIERKWEKELPDQLQRSIDSEVR